MDPALPDPAPASSAGIAMASADWFRLDRAHRP
jgi:hypothetical protein